VKWTFLNVITDCVLGPLNPNHPTISYNVQVLQAVGSTVVGGHSSVNVALPWHVLLSADSWNPGWQKQMPPSGDEWQPWSHDNELHSLLPTHTHTHTHTHITTHQILLPHTSPTRCMHSVVRTWLKSTALDRSFDLQTYTPTTKTSFNRGLFFRV